MLAALPPRTSAVDVCEGTLRRQILGGDLPAGTRLPPERDLAASLGASRVTVRSALARLAKTNLLSVRQGSGYVVRDFHRDGGPDLLPGVIELARGRDVVGIAADLLLVRRKLAAAVLERLMEHATPRALAHVDAAIDDLARLAERGASTEEVAEGDVEIVARLLLATKSPVLQLCLNPILTILRGMPALRDAMFASPFENVAGWRALVSWATAREIGAVSLAVQELERRDSATLARLARKGASR